MAVEPTERLGSKRDAPRPSHRIGCLSAAQDSAKRTKSGGSGAWASSDAASLARNSWPPL